jgi:NADPH:quinone reductase-like Zn-dependent oxidoreductase
MRAVVYYEYGSPDVLRIEDVAKPAVEDDGVLVRVRAAAANPLDWRCMRGGVLRLMEGLRRPKTGRIGLDLAGQVEAVGKNVTQLAPGVEVFGCCRGSFAEYVCAKESQLAPKPAGLTFEQAAAIGLAGTTALQALRDAGRLQPGQSVLVNGASGGVGTFAVQIAKALGARVTGVCSTRNLDLVRSLGADEVIDYTKEDFTARGRRHDLLLDTVANRSLSDCGRTLAPGGVGLLVGAPHENGRLIVFMLRAALAARFRKPKFRLVLTNAKRADLLVLKELVESGKLVPVIDRAVPLSDAAEAIRHLEQGHARGKVVVKM